jgi:hypothetical protein
MNTAIATMAVAGWGLVAYWTAAIATRRGRSFWRWFAAGLLGGVVLLIAAGVMKPKATDRHFSLVVPTISGIVGLLFLGGVVVEGVASGRLPPSQVPTPRRSQPTHAPTTTGATRMATAQMTPTSRTSLAPRPHPPPSVAHSTLLRSSPGR